MRNAVVLAVVVAAYGCAPTGEAAARQFMASADRHLASGRYEAAAIEYRNAIKHLPSWAEAHRKLGDAQKALGNAESTYRSYREACRLAPNDTRTCLAAVQVLLDGGLSAEADRLARDLVDRAPQDADVHIALATAATRLGRVTEAAARLDAAIALNPLPEAFAALGDLRAGTGDTAAAEQAFRLGVEHAPRSPEARVHLARFLADTERIEEAEAELLQAIEIDPGDELANRALASLYVGANRADAAEPYLVRAAERSDPQLNSLLALADFYAGAGRWEEAQAVLDRAPREGPVARGARLRLAAVQYEKGERDTAHRTLEPLLTKKASAETWTLHAQLLAREGRFEEALTSARKAVAIQPDAEPAQQIIAAVDAHLKP